MTKNERIKRKADMISDLYELSDKIEKDDAFNGYNLDFCRFGICFNDDNISEIADALGCEVRTELTGRYFTYRDIDYFQNRDVERELEKALNRVKELEQQNIAII